LRNRAEDFKIAAFLKYILSFRCYEKQFEDVMDGASLHFTDIGSYIDIMKGKLDFQGWVREW